MKKHLLFFISCLLCITSIILFHINQLLAGLGIFIFIVSLLFLIFTKRKLSNKLILLLLFVLIGGIGMISGIISQGGYANDEYFISDSVKGKFRVIFTRNHGEIPREENNWFIININDNIQYFKRPIESSFYRQRFCIVNNEGEKTWLKEIKSMDEFDGQPSILVFTPQYWEKEKVNINDFMVITSKENIIDNQDYLDSLSIELLKILNKNNR